MIDADSTRPPASPPGYFASTSDPFTACTFRPLSLCVGPWKSSFKKLGAGCVSVARVSFPRSHS
jgi:hypothetical protein